MAQKERWASRVGLVLAMAGNAVGLGNFLRFPAQAAANGGGAFLIPYFVALIIVGLPLIWCEWAMGRYGGMHGHHSTPGVFHTLGRSRLWKYFGVMGLWSCLVIASYYLYIESWCLSYAGYSAWGGFADKSVAEVREFFNRDLTGQTDYEIMAISGWGMAIFALCVIINIYILSRGLAKGIELVSKIGMPLLILFAAILAVRGLLLQPGVDPGVKHSPLEGLNFVWQPNLNSLADPTVWLAAAGQIFFTLSIGMGSIHCYASYLREQDDVALTGATAGWTNEFCEVVLGGTILIPIAVAYMGLNEVQAITQGGSGFSLGFFTMPTLFNKWGWFAQVAGFMWYGLLFFAAITSSLAMGQPIMAFFQQEFGVSRQRSALLFGLCLLPLALPVALFNSQTFNDEFDYWAGTVMLVVFAFVESILFAWVFGMTRGWEEINKGAELKVPVVFRFIIKYVTPVFLFLILMSYMFKPVGEVPVLDQSGKPVLNEKGEPKTTRKGWQAYVDGLTGKGPMPKTWEFDGGGMIGKLMHNDINDSLAAATDPKAKQFYIDLKFWRDMDRLLLVGVYLFFSLLVFVAWSKRAREGRA